MCSALAEYHLGEQHHDTAITWANAVVKENPCDERAHQILMRAYAASGRRSEALRQYARCQQILKDELGLEPLDETRQVFADLFHSSNP
jgi:DNA-binding SARP family transcriptional activator